MTALIQGGRDNLVVNTHAIGMLGDGPFELGLVDHGQRSLTGIGEPIRNLSGGSDGMFSLPVPHHCGHCRGRGCNPPVVVGRKVVV